MLGGRGKGELRVRKRLGRGGEMLGLLWVGELLLGLGGGIVVGIRVDGRCGGGVGDRTGK